MSTMHESVLVRHMILNKDIARLVEIETLCFGKSIGYDREEIAKLYENRSNVIVVAERRDITMGWMVHRPLRANFRLDNLAVHPEWQRCGIGGALIDYLTEKARLKRFGCFTFVPEDMVSMQLLLRAKNFECTDIRKEYYANTPGDAYRFDLIEYKK